MDFDIETWANRYWHEENAKGNGFAVGEDTDDINEIVGIGELKVASHSNDKVAVYYDSEKEVFTIVADSHGPWAVESKLDGPKTRYVVLHGDQVYDEFYQGDYFDTYTEAEREIETYAFPNEFEIEKVTI